MPLNDDAFNYVVKPACNTCKHFNLFSNPPSCAAYNVIPDEILDGDEPHILPVRGDKGIQWEKRDEN